MGFEAVEKFEKKIADWFGAPYAVAVDSCTHGIELSLRLLQVEKIKVPTRTYISIPFLAEKLKITRQWVSHEWKDYYFLTDRIADAAVLWKKNSYILNSLMSISFQYQKHLSLGRGGMILTDNKEEAVTLKRMSYDGRAPNKPWRDQDIDTVGYHYYMTPETAQTGLDKLPSAIQTTPRDWVLQDWPDLTRMTVFKK